MLPPARVVLENPLFHGVSLNAETWRLVATADEPAIHLPLTVASLEPEGTSDALLISGIGESVEVNRLLCRNSCRIDAVISYCRTIDDDLQYLRSSTSACDVTIRSASIVLLQAILEIERLAGVIGEVHNHVIALSYGETHAIYQHRLLNKVAVR